MTEREHADVSRRNPDTLEKRETSRWLDVGSGRLQLTAFAIAVLLFVVTVVGLGTMPICNE